MKVKIFCFLVILNLLSNPPSCYTKKLTDTLTQLVTEATRVVPNSSTLIDLIYTSNDNKIEESGVIHTSISDHSLVYVVWGKSRTSKTKHLYTKGVEILKSLMKRNFV